MTVLQLNQTPCQTHQCILHSRARCLQAFSGVLHLLLDLWQQSFELLQLLPLLWQSLWTFGFVKHLLQLVWNCINYCIDDSLEANFTPRADAYQACSL